MSVIFVRNDGAGITYVGDWTIVQATTVNTIVSPAFSPTLHSTTTIGSFTFPFQGSSIDVVGTINVANSSTSPAPTWQCFVDGKNLAIPNIPQSNNRFIESFCSQDNIPDGAHELIVNVTSSGTPFYLDKIEYRPSSNVSRENSFIMIENNDPGVNFISGWGPLDIRVGTTDPNSLVNVTFVGIQLSWYGFIPVEEPHGASSGEYSIDGQPYTPFQLTGLPQSFSATAFNHLFFETQTLEMGSHTLSVKYTGSPGQTPLTFEYLVITNGSFSSSSSSPSASSPESSPSSTSASSPGSPPNSSGGVRGIPTSIGLPSTSDTRKNSSNVGSIVGGVVGAVGGIAVCSIIIFFWLRSRKWKNRDNAVNRRSVIEPFVAQPQFASQAASSSTSRQTTRSHDPTYTRHPSGSQPNMSQAFNTASSPNTPASPYTTDETIVGSRRPLPVSPVSPVSPARLMPSLPPVGKSATRAPTGPIQHGDSGIRLSQPVLAQIVVEMPPSYSEQ